MLDPTIVRDRIDDVRRALQTRGLQPDTELDQFAQLDADRRRLIPEIEGLKREQNAAAGEAARAKREGQDGTSLFAANKARGQRVKQLEVQLEEHRAAAKYGAADAAEPAARNCP